MVETTPAILEALRRNQPIEHKEFGRRLVHWIAELLLVFVGVYGAFWLNNYQQHRGEIQRRDRILGQLEQQLRESIESGRGPTAKEDSTAAEFRKALDAGEMPPLHPFTFTTDYNPSDTSTLLQAGGVDLLDPKTLAAMREVESVIRWGLSRIDRYQKLSDELIVPNLAKGLSFFYNAETRKLEPQFQFYPEALQATADFAHDLERAQTKLLEQIRGERQRRQG